MAAEASSNFGPCSKKEHITEHAKHNDTDKGENGDNN